MMQLKNLKKEWKRKNQKKKFLHTFLKQICRHSAPDDVSAKRKCGADFAYLVEGCGRTQAKIDDAIPHTRIDMGYGHHVWCQPHDLNKQ